MPKLPVLLIGLFLHKILAVSLISESDLLQSLFPPTTIVDEYYSLYKPNGINKDLYSTKIRIFRRKCTLSPRMIVLGISFVKIFILQQQSFLSLGYNLHASATAPPLPLFCSPQPNMSREFAHTVTVVNKQHQ